MARRSVLTFCLTKGVHPNIHAACLADSRQVEVLPLFVQTQNTELIGTGICHTELEQSAELAIPGRVFFTSAGTLFTLEVDCFTTCAVL